MKLSIQAGSTSQTVNVFIQDSSSTTGAGLTGLVYNSSGLTAYYALPRAVATSITLATLAAVTSSYSSGGFKEIDATNMPGWYRFDVPDAALASGRFVSIHLKGATNMAPLPIEIELTGWNNQDAVRGGMTALPNANAEAAGGLYTRGSGAGQINQAANGQIDVNVARWLNTAVTAATAGIPDINVKNMNNVSGAAITTIKAVQGLTTADTFVTVSGNVNGNVAGSVGSVTGNVGGNVVGSVGSVTGNVGGNVTGSIGSLAAQAKADVNAEVLDVLNVDTFAQPGQTTPAATTSIRLMLAWLYKAWRNRTVQTLTEYDLYNDDAVTVDQKAPVTITPSTSVDRGEIVTGP